MNDDSHIKKMITDAGLKVTPQRLMVLRALYEMNNHPSAEQVLEFIRRANPHMGTGTVYNILEVFADKGVIKRVKSEKGILRYDPIRESHHHLYCTDTEKIEDYYDKELSELLDDYFSKRRIQGFEIDEISLHIIGKYNINRKN